MNTCMSIIHTLAHPYTHTNARARSLSRSLSLSLSLIPALPRTNTHAFAHIFMSACMHAPMCMVRVSRYKRECVDCTYTHVHACRCVYLHTRAHTHAHMYIQTPMHYRERDAYEQCSWERDTYAHRNATRSNAFTNVHTCTLYTWAWIHKHMSVLMHISSMNDTFNSAHACARMPVCIGLALLWSKIKKLKFAS